MIISPILVMLGYQLLGAGIGIGVAALLHYKDFLVNMCRNFILPAIGRSFWQASDAIRRILDIIEKSVAYTTLQAKIAIDTFRYNVLSMISRYQRVYGNHVQVTSNTYVFRQGEWRNITTNQIASMDELPEHVREELKKRSTVEVNHHDDLVNLIRN